MSGVPKKQYDPTKPIKQVSNVDEYNQIGIQEAVNPAEKKQHDYSTRKNVVQKDENPKVGKIDKKNPVEKKTIIIPQTEIDKRYRDILESKKKILQTISE